MKQRIFRVQDKEGRGPFRPGFTSVWAQHKSDSFYRKAIPWHIEFPDVFDLIVTNPLNLNYGCGCRTLKQLRAWFTNKEIRKLKKYGYSVVILDVDKIIAESEIQVVFGTWKPLQDCVVRKI